MKNVSYSQYRREMERLERDAEYDEPDIAPSEFATSFDSNTFTNKQIEVLSRELHDCSLRERLLKSTNDFLTKALNSLKVSESSKGVLEECRDNLRQIREILQREAPCNLKQFYELEISNIKLAHTREKCQLKSHYQKQIDRLQQEQRQDSHHTSQEVRIKMYAEPKKEPVKSLMGYLSPKQYENLPKQSGSRLKYSELMTSPSNADSILSHRIDRNNISFVKSPDREPSMNSGRLEKKMSRHVRRNSAIEMSFAGHKNVATDLLCDLCNTSYSPVEFFSHIGKCKQNQVIDISEVDEEDEEKSISLSVLEQLLKKKQELEDRIQILHDSKGDHQSEKERLETDLDQIVCIIQNKSSMKKDGKKGLNGEQKENRNISIYKVNIGDESKSSCRLSMGSQAFTKKTSSRKEFKGSRVISRK